MKKAKKNNIEKLKRDPKETLYVDRMGETEDGIDGWGIFGINSGFCYGSYSSENQAEKALKDKTKKENL